LLQAAPDGQGRFVFADRFQYGPVPLTIRFFMSLSGSGLSDGVAVKCSYDGDHHRREDVAHYSQPQQSDQYEERIRFDLVVKRTETFW